MNVELPNGVVIEGVPDGTNRYTVLAKALEAGHITPEQIGQENYSPVSDSGFQNFRAGFGKAFVDLGRGAKDLVADAFGSEEASDVEIAGSRRRDAPLMESGAGLAGNIGGNVAAFIPAAAVPGANTAVGAGMIGATAGLLQPALEGERGANVAIGGLLGAGGNVAGQALSRALNPRTSQAAGSLLDDGVTLTPGQAAGGAVKRAEDAMTSVPGVGDAIKSGQRAAVEDWNRSVANRVLGNIGQAVPDDVPVGREMIKHVGDTLGDAYDDLMPDLAVVADDTFRAELASLDDMVRDLADEGAQFRKLVDRAITKRMSPKGGMQGQTLKEAESDLGGLAIRYRKSTDANQQRLGDALTEAQAALRRLVERSNPSAREQLAAINKGWAELVRIEKAAGMAGSKDGIFSPAALRSAVKSTDGSSRKRAVARGDALLQDAVEAAEGVLGPTVPDSGTPGRMLTTGLLAGLYDPTALAAMGAGAAAYGTQAGRRGLLAGMTSRPESVRAAGRGIEELLPFAPAAAGGLLPAY